MARFKVLIVHPEGVVRRRLLRAIEDGDREVRSVAGWDDALASCAGATPDLVITPLELPAERSGLDLPEALRDGGQGVSAVLLAGDFDLDMLVAATRKGRS